MTERVGGEGEQLRQQAVRLRAGLGGTPCTSKPGSAEFSSVAAYERIDRDVLQRRLLLALFALGTNMGIRAIVATGEHGETEAALRHVRRHFITVDNLHAAVTKLVNATFAARDTTWWGRGTACASDSKKFGSWSQTS